MGGLLGGGANSTSGSGMVGGQQRGSNRLFARRVFNTRSNYQSNGATTTTSGMILNGGYRSVMNAGDPLWRYNKACGGSDQVSGRIRNGANASARGPLAGGGCCAANCGESVNFGSLVFVTRNDLNQLASGNQRYVADSSSFTRFKKTASLNGNYNDYSFGGDIPSNQKVALGRVRG